MSGTIDGSGVIFGDFAVGQAGNLAPIWGIVGCAADGEIGFPATNQERIWYSPALVGALQDGFINGTQTFCYYLSNPNSPNDYFAGTIWIEGTSVAMPMMPDWAPVPNTLRIYTAGVALDVVNVQGDFLWLRVAVEPLSGSLDHVLYKG